MIYEYDFGDGCEHSVVLEKVLTRSGGATSPSCIAGARSGPPEDCGGYLGNAQRWRWHKLATASDSTSSWEQGWTLLRDAGLSLPPIGSCSRSISPAGARASGRPFSFFAPTEMLAMARDAGFKEARHVSAAMLAQRYFAGRTDGLRPPNSSEELLVATTWR